MHWAGLFALKYARDARGACSRTTCAFSASGVHLAAAAQRRASGRPANTRLRPSGGVPQMVELRRLSFQRRSWQCEAGRREVVGNGHSFQLNAGSYDPGLTAGAGGHRRPSSSRRCWPDHIGAHTAARPAGGATHRWKGLSSNPGTATPDQQGGGGISWFDRQRHWLVAQADKARPAAGRCGGGRLATSLVRGTWQGWLGRAEWRELAAPIQGFSAQAVSGDGCGAGAELASRRWPSGVSTSHGETARLSGDGWGGCRHDRASRAGVIPGKAAGCRLGDQAGGSGWR